MARIRSIHPGMATDEAYMAMSIYCKAAWPLLWTECDDQGSFEWKPLVLKARIFPVEHIDFEQLLAEWERMNCVRKYQQDGKNYGLVRNFCRFQRPKKPKYRHVISDELRTYVGLTDDGSVPVPHQDETDGEISPQREEGGGRREEEDASSETIVSSEASPPPAKKSKRRPRAPLPDGYRLSDEGRGYAKRNGLSDNEIAREFEKFTNNARQNDRRCADWEAAWRNWVLKAFEFAGREPAGEVVPLNPQGFHAKLDSPQYRAWQLVKQKTMPNWAALDRDGGWHFPTEWPPGYDEDGMPDFCNRNKAQTP